MGLFSRRRRSADDDDLFAVSNAPGSFLGALTSDSAQLPDGFDPWRSAVVEAVSLYQSGSVSRTGMLERLAQLRFRDVAGNEWTVGATHHQWFMRTSDSDWQSGQFPILPTYEQPPAWDVDSAAPTDTTVTPVGEESSASEIPAWASHESADRDFAEQFHEPDLATPHAPLTPRQGSVDAAADQLVSEASTFLSDPLAPHSDTPASLLPPLSMSAPGDAALPDQPWHEPLLGIGDSEDVPPAVTPDAPLPVDPDLPPSA